MSATASPADVAAAAVATAAADSGASAVAAAAAAAELKSGNSSDVDSEMQSNKPLFLNFTAELAPFSGSSKKQKKKSNVYKVSGVNILNRNSVDSKTALERLQRRRENHNFVERRRRDNINHTIMSLSTIIPYCAEEGVKLNKGSILHMAVDYIHDLQDINQALAEENIRLGGSGNIQLPGRRHHRDSLHNSSADTTAQHSHDEDSDGNDDDGDDGERTLAQSLAASPKGASATSISTAVAAAIGGGKTPKRRRVSPASSTKGSARKAASATKRSKKSAETSASSSSTSIHSGSHHLSGVLSPSLTTAPPSAAQSANTSPVALAASIGAGATPSRSSVHLPPTSAIVQKHQATLPPIGAVAGLGAAAAGAGHMPLSAAAASTGIAPLMPIAQQHPHFHHQQHQQQQHAAVRQPLVAQSMPSSPNFRAHFPSSVSGAGRYADPHLHGGRQMPAINSHPFFTDVSSIRHHMQQQQQQHNLPAVLENQEQADKPASNANTLYNSGRPGQQSAYYPQSLQNTPMMRPNREFAKGSDALELPSIVSIRLPPPPASAEPQKHHH